MYVIAKTDLYNIIFDKINSESMDKPDLVIEVKKEHSNASWIFFFRQLFTCAAVVLNFFTCGMYMGAPTVIIPQLRKEANSTDVVTPEMASWLSSTSSYSSIPWGFILPLLAYRFGRKYILVWISVSVLIGNIVFYCSTSITELIVSQAIQGILVASITTINMMVMSEYTSPKYRGVLLAVNSATFYWGVWVSNAIGTFYHWRNIGTVIFVCSIYNLSSIFYKESPYWLATKGRFDECTKVHRWLKGTDENSEDELKNLISSQQEHIKFKSEIKRCTNYKPNIKIFNILRYESFYKPFVYAMLPIGLYHFSGKLAYTVYALDIIKKLTSSEKMAYGGMLILDAVTVLGMYIGCGLAKIARRRAQLIILSSVGITFLFVLSIYLYIVNLNILSENKYVSLFLLSAFSISSGGGPIILSASYTAELCPLRYRSYFLCCLSIANNTILATVVKFSPIIFKYFGTHGAFLFYAISSSVFLILVYKYMPETKDLTIQEIQECIARGDHFGKGFDRETLPLK